MRRKYVASPPKINSHFKDVEFLSSADCLITQRNYTEQDERQFFIILIEDKLLCLNSKIKTIYFNLNWVFPCISLSIILSIPTNAHFIKAQNAQNKRGNQKSNFSEAQICAP
jgi:hypothetical protein